MCSLKPTEFNVVIKLDKATDRTPGGIILPTAASDRDKLSVNHQFRERDLSRHLENKRKKKAEPSDDPKQKLLDQLQRDNQLKLALELVKYFPIKTVSQ